MKKKKKKEKVEVNVKHHLHSRELYSQRLVNVGLVYSTQRSLLYTLILFAHSQYKLIHFDYFFTSTI